MTIALPKPGSDRRKVLDLIVLYPGELGTAELAAHMWPPVKEGPPKSLSDMRCRRCVEKPVATTSEGPCRSCRRKEADKAAQAKVSAMLRQLGTKGLISACGPPVLSGWFVASMKKRGMAAAIMRAHPAYPAETPPLDAHISMLWRAEDGVPSVADLLGKSPSGALKQVYRELCAWGVLIPPGQRWPTAAGIALVSGV